MRLGEVAVVLFSGALFTTDNYVDTNNGNDVWNGSSATRAVVSGFAGPDVGARRMIR